MSITGVGTSTGKNVIGISFCRYFCPKVETEVLIYTTILSRTVLSFSPRFGKFEKKKKPSDWLNRMVGKEEIARYEQFLLFSQCFLLNQKIVSPFVKIYDNISLFAAELEELKIGI